jgi:hypothetical protein
LIDYSFVLTYDFKGTLLLYGTFPQNR